MSAALIGAPRPECGTPLRGRIFLGKATLSGGRDTYVEWDCPRGGYAHRRSWTLAFDPAGSAENNVLSRSSNKGIGMDIDARLIDFPGRLILVVLIRGADVVGTWQDVLSQDPNGLKLKFPESTTWHNVVHGAQAEDPFRLITVNKHDEDLLLLIKPPGGWSQTEVSVRWLSGGITDYSLHIQHSGS